MRSFRRCAALLANRTLRSSALFAVSGAAFAIGNLCLAATMVTRDYAALSLVLGIYVVSGHVAPIGIDQLMLRRAIEPRKLTGLLAVVGTPVAIATAATASLGYGLSAGAAWTAGLLTFVGSFLAVTACTMRRTGSLVVALLIDTSGNWVLLATGLISLILPLSLNTGLCIFLCSAIIVALWGWHAMPAVAAEDIIGWNRRVVWEALALLGISVAGTALIQTERLVTPIVLDLHALALFGILTSVAIAPFRMLAAGLGYALTKDLRDAPSPDCRTAAVRHELWVCAGAIVVAVAIVLCVAPALVRVTVGDRFQIDLAMLAAACVNGIAKAVQSLPRAIVTAIGRDRDIHMLNGLAWLGVGCGVAGAVAGGHHSLTMLMVGAGLGNLIGSAASARVAWLALRRG
jgi:hypothetical protein